MKKSKFHVIVAFLLMGVFFFINLSSVYAQEKPRVAIVDFYVTKTTSYQDIQQKYNSNAEIMVGAITTAVVNTNRFRVVERSRIDQIIREQRFQRSNLTAEQVVTIGKLLGVNKLITGEYKQENSEITINIRLIDVQTGDIEAATSYQSVSWELIKTAETLVTRLLK